MGLVDGFMWSTSSAVRVLGHHQLLFDVLNLLFDGGCLLLRCSTFVLFGQLIHIIFSIFQSIHTLSDQVAAYDITQYDWRHTWASAREISEGRNESFFNVDLGAIKTACKDKIRDIKMQRDSLTSSDQFSQREKVIFWFRAGGLGCYCQTVKFNQSTTSSDLLFFEVARLGEDFLHSWSRKSTCRNWQHVLELENCVGAWLKGLIVHFRRWRGNTIMISVIWQTMSVVASSLSVLAMWRSCCTKYLSCHLCSVNNNNNQQQSGKRQHRSRWLC